MKRKQTYVAPQSEALSVETKGVLCGSPMKSLIDLEYFTVDNTYGELDFD